MKLGLIGGGMVGQCYANALMDSGLELCGIWDARPAASLMEFARARRLQVHTGPGPWLADADIMLSAVFGSVALEVAGAAFERLRRGALFVDMTTAAPEDMVRAERLAAAADQHFVDVAIVGAVNVHGPKTPLLCAGAKAEEVAQLFRAVGAPVQVVGSVPGDASSLKMLRSIFTKGLEALVVECLTTAEKRGLRTRLHEILADMGARPLKDMMESILETHIEHSARRRTEVEEVQRQMHVAGIHPLVLPAVEQLFRRTADRQAALPYEGHNLDEALHWLIEAATPHAGLHD
jgi:3-hydroxyisobutyrate dehydrogenase-like beta-hydroxyacid dehydrogenase